MIDGILWSTGLVVWACIGFLLVWLLYDIVRAAIVAASQARFLFGVCKKHSGLPPYWAAKLPILYASCWWKCLWGGWGTLYSSGGEWRGVGDWNIYPERIED